MWIAARGTACDRGLAGSCTGPAAFTALVPPENRLAPSRDHRVLLAQLRGSSSADKRYLDAVLEGWQAGGRNAPAPPTSLGGPPPFLEAAHVCESLNAAVCESPHGSPSAPTSHQLPAEHQHLAAERRTPPTRPPQLPCTPAAASGAAAPAGAAAPLDVGATGRGRRPAANRAPQLAPSSERHACKPGTPERNRRWGQATHQAAAPPAAPCRPAAAQLQGPGPCRSLDCRGRTSAKLTNSHQEVS